ncbi:UNKNOWN [Stylonychia lemnae]|uniref:Uncharacterized protein n=1 Tax=Stylonychia lemnae TaxID=5949 RepID=A0A078AIE7_STYLE|nr:UNKNOWN [Stylonychia lemnae]|eukprot:CDW81716.1 UNKNOWN [Stylonychia lemnae]
MDFLSKQMARVGKQNVNLEINFQPLLLKVNVTKPGEYQLFFKRGPQTNETKKYNLDKSSGMSITELIFENESFTKVSGFYQEKDGTFQEKKAVILIKGAGDKVCEHTLDLAKYIHRGPVKERLQLTGTAYHLDFEITVQDPDPAKRVINAPKEDDFQLNENPYDHRDTKAIRGEPLPGDESHVKRSVTSNNTLPAHQVKTENLKPEIDLTTQKLEQSQKEANQLKQTLEDLQKRLNDAQLRNQQLLAEKEESIAKLDGTQDQENKLKNKCGNLEKEVENLRKEVGGLYRFDSTFN